MWRRTAVAVIMSIFVMTGVGSLAPAGDAAGEPARKLFLIQENGKYGYMDKKGKIVIKPQFEHAEDFQEGRALISVDRRYGYIDEQGKVVVAPQYDAAFAFQEGLAAVATMTFPEDEETGFMYASFIDKAGNVRIQTEGLLSGGFSEGYGL